MLLQVEDVSVSEPKRTLGLDIGEDFLTARVLGPWDRETPALEVFRNWAVTLGDVVCAGAGLLQP